MVLRGGADSLVTLAVIGAPPGAAWAQAITGPNKGNPPTPTGAPPPPATRAAAIVGYYRPAQDWTLQLGAFDGAAGNPNSRARFVDIKFEGALMIAQVEKRFGDAFQSRSNGEPSLTGSVYHSSIIVG